MDMYRMIGMKFPFFIAGKKKIVPITNNEKQHETTE